MSWMSRHARHARHRQIRDDQVGAVALDPPQQFLPGRRLDRDLHPRDGLEDKPRPLPHQLVVVHEHDVR